MTTAAQHAVATPARLERHGRLSWPDARGLLAGTTCAWADLAGFHLAPAADLPVAVPQATHVWAWDGGARCFRLRIDGAQARVAALHVGDDGGGLRVRIRPGRPWSENERHVGPLRPEVYQLDFELLEVAGATPVTFVRAVRPSAS